MCIRDRNIRANQLLDPKFKKNQGTLGETKHSNKPILLWTGWYLIHKKYIEPRRLESNHSQNHGKRTSVGIPHKIRTYGCSKGSVTIGGELLHQEHTQEGTKLYKTLSYLPISQN